MKNKRIFYLFMTVVLILSCFGASKNNLFTIYAFADTVSEMEDAEAETKEAITSLERESEDTRSAIKELENQKKEAEGNVSSLENQKDALSSEISAYSAQLDVLDGEILEAREKLAATSNEIIELYNMLEENKQKKDDLYLKLKKQIQTAYETRSNQSLLLALFGSKSMKDLLNQVEYVSAVVAYQQRLLANYQEIEDEIKLQAAELEEKQAELDMYQATLDEKQEQIEDLATDVKSALRDTNASISSEKSKIDNYDSKLAELDKKMKALESQVAAAQAKLAQQIAARMAAGTKEDTSGSYAASASELEWLAATIQAEAGGESYTGKLAVGSVIMNRVMSSKFPNSVQAVITQNMQFASYRSGKVELIIANGPNSTCVQAAQEVLNGARVGDYLFFMTKYYADYYGIAEYNMIGNHAFFYKWVTIPKEEPKSEENNEEANVEENTTQEEHIDDNDSQEEHADENNDEKQVEENNEGTPEEE